MALCGDRTGKELTQGCVLHCQKQDAVPKRDPLGLLCSLAARTTTFNGVLSLSELFLVSGLSLDIKQCNSLPQETHLACGCE